MDKRISLKAPMKENPKVSIVIPCLNEEKYIGKCLNSILENNYPNDKIEVLVIDGKSNDMTKEIVRHYSDKYLFFRLLENPKGKTSAGLNIGIQNSSGEIIIRMDAHARYSSDYISKCVETLEKYKADNVGGIIQTIPGAETLVAKSIALALAHPFGVGNSSFRTARRTDRPQEVDTVPFGCFYRTLFSRVGLYNENLPHWKARSNEDFDLNRRIRENGGKILLFPQIESYYFARDTLKKFWLHSFNNGVLTTLPLWIGNFGLSPRHLIPLFFTIFIALFPPITFLFFPKLQLFVFLVFGLYILLSLYFSFRRAMTKRNLLYFIIMPIVFFVFHLSYGLGSLWGLLKEIPMKLKFFCWS